MQKGGVFVNPVEKLEQARVELEDALDLIRPGVESDGGYLELVDFDIEQGTVEVHMGGACGGCPMSTMTLKMGVERAVKAKVDWVMEVAAV